MLSCLACKNVGKPTENYTPNDFTFIFAGRNLQKLIILRVEIVAQKNGDGHFALIFTCRNLQKVRSTRTSEVYTSGKIVRKKQVKVGFVYFRSPELFQSLQK